MAPTVILVAAWCLRLLPKGRRAFCTLSKERMVLHPFYTLGRATPQPVHEHTLWNDDRWRRYRALQSRRLLQRLRSGLQAKPVVADDRRSESITVSAYG